MRASARGKRSGIGLYGFVHGGFILDEGTNIQRRKGHGAFTRLRFGFIPIGRVVLITPQQQGAITGGLESGLMEQLGMDPILIGSGCSNWQCGPWRLHRRATGLMRLSRRCRSMLTWLESCSRRCKAVVTTDRVLRLQPRRRGDWGYERWDRVAGAYRFWLCPVGASGRSDCGAA